MICLIVLVLTLGTVVGNDEATIITECSGDIVLPCFALQKCQKYTSVTWYKLYNNSSDKLTMTILIKSENVIQNENHYNSVLLDKNASLILRKVAPADSGIYMCFIRAKVGKMNCHRKIRLNISDCASTPAIFDSSTKFINESWSNITFPMTQVDEKSEHLIICGCIGVAVSKLVLSAVFIWVFKKLSELKR